MTDDAARVAALLESRNAYRDRLRAMLGVTRPDGEELIALVEARFESWATALKIADAAWKARARRPDAPARGEGCAADEAEEEGAEVTRSNLLRIGILALAVAATYAALTVPASVGGRTYEIGIMAGLAVSLVGDLGRWLFRRIR